MSQKLVYKRVLIKISGESLGGTQKKGIDFSAVAQIVDEICEARRLGVDIALVVGGGNIFRGREVDKSIDRVSSDYMGMLGTCINALALQECLENKGQKTRVQTAIHISQIAEPYIRRKALRHLEKGRIVIFAAGIGNPYFTTDTAAALRAMEIGAEVVLKATQVDGMYERNPKDKMSKEKNKKFNEIQYIEVLSKNLKLLDATAVSLCMDNKMPMIAFKLAEKGNIIKILYGEQIGTRIQ